MGCRHVLSIIFIISFVTPVFLTKRSIFLAMDSNMREGDDVVLEGTFRRRLAMVRFLSSYSSCSGGTLRGSGRRPQCQPLVLKFRPVLHKMEVFYKGALNNNRDVWVGTFTHDNIAVGQSYRLVIHVGNQEYEITLNGVSVATVVDRIGHSEISEIRSYGGDFVEYYVAHNNPTAPEVNIRRPGENENNEATCGTRPGLTTAAVRIIGGSNAKRGEFPWQVALRRSNPLPWDQKHRCGGSLLSSCWVVTAAHCIGDVRGDDSEFSRNFYIRAGDYHNGDADESYSHYEDQQDLPIHRVHVHPEYSADPNPRNDIALIRLTGDSNNCARFSELVRPVCLPKRSDVFSTKSRCTITGWGAQNATYNIFPDKLQKTNVQIRDHGTCRNSYGGDRVADRTVCAAGPGRDACQGDSGGPLVCMRDQVQNGEGTNFLLWGITSWGDGCADPDKPGIYTRVVDFIDWINQVMSTQNP